MFIPSAAAQRHLDLGWFGEGLRASGTPVAAMRWTVVSAGIASMSTGNEQAGNHKCNLVARLPVYGEQTVPCSRSLAYYLPWHGNADAIVPSDGVASIWW
jgi:hypothetical protein